MEKISFHLDRILLHSYGFQKPQHRMVLPNEIKSVRWSRYPPELELNNGEILFLPASLRPELRLFFQTHKIPTVRGPDLWSYLLEPYLDSEISAEWKERVDRKLSDNGIPSTEVDEIRNVVRTSMQRYSSVVWEWVHLGHSDVLHAHAWMPEKEFQEFYDWTMKIAARSSSMMTLEEDPPLSPASLQSLAASRLADFIGFDKPPGVREELMKPLLEAYSEPHRHHHTLQRVIDVVDMTRALALRVRLSAEESRALQVAAWFQDFVLVPGAKDNEEKSAEALQACWKESDAVVNLALQLIRMTKNPFRAQSTVEKILADADLSILGADPFSYRFYSESIRREYSTLSDHDYRIGRLRFLEGIRDRQISRPLFHFLQPIFEERARENITSEILKTGPF